MKSSRLVDFVIVLPGDAISGERTLEAFYSLDESCASSYLGRRRGEFVQTRTAALQASVYQCLGTFSGASQAISVSLQLHALSLNRLDNRHGNEARMADLVGLASVMWGRIDDLLDLPEGQARLARLPDQQPTHPETGTGRALFDFPSCGLP